MLRCIIGFLPRHREGRPTLGWIPSPESRTSVARIVHSAPSTRTTPETLSDGTSSLYKPIQDKQEYSQRTRLSFVKETLPLGDYPPTLSALSQESRLERKATSSTQLTLTGTTSASTLAQYSSLQASQYHPAPHWRTNRSLSHPRPLEEHHPTRSAGTLGMAQQGRELPPRTPIPQSKLSQ